MKARESMNSPQGRGCPCRVDLLLYEKYLEGSAFQVLLARTVGEARRVLRRVRPVAVLLNILLEAESGWTLLAEIKGQAATRDIPILVLSIVEGKEQALALAPRTSVSSPSTGTGC
jgi:DNA-binding response OmpR family regulator